MAQFGERYTPNQHNLARNFVTLDNFYDTAEVSNDGWLWTTAARAPDVVERQFAVTYAGRGLSLDSEGLSGGIEFPWAVARMVLEHHEKMNGSGYPQGLSGDKLLIESRIIAVADVVEAMASDRPYRPGLGIGKALDEISKNRGVLYDQEVVDVCLRLFNEKGYKLEG